MDQEVTSREVGEHIDNIKLGLRVDDDDMVCSKLHGNLARATIWLLRKIEEIIKYILSNGPQKGHMVLKLGSLEIPLQRGMTPRDIGFLVGLGYFIYVSLQYKGIVP